MLTVVVPATGSRLTTPARAAAMLGVSNDGTIEMAIDAASQMIVDHCRRPFAAQTVRELFRSPRGGLLLARAPVTDIAVIEDSGITLGAEDYELDGEVLCRVSGLCRVAWVGPVSVTYTAGFSLPADTGLWTLPAAVERAAILVIGAILANRSRDPLMRSETVEGIGSTTWWVPEGGALPSAEAETLISTYRRIVG